MKVYVNISDLIAHLHEMGFTSDFDLRVEGILWVQENSLLSREDFFITECHRFLNIRGNAMEVCGIVTTNYLAKGILIIHDKHKSLQSHTIIQNKIAFLSSSISDIEDQFGYAYSGDIF